MAYLSFHLVPGIPVYPSGRKPEGKGKDIPQQADGIFCTGLWHGANWTFIIWGLWHGFFIVAEDAAKSCSGLESMEKQAKPGGNSAETPIHFAGGTDWFVISGQTTWDRLSR